MEFTSTYSNDIPFTGDRQSKYDFTASTVNYISSISNGEDVTVVFKEFDKDGNLVEFDSENSSITSRMDLVMFYNDVPYLVELKERKGRYTSDSYGVEGKEGWFVNVEKQAEFAKNQWAIPLFVNLFPDGKVIVWNLNRIKEFPSIVKGICKYNDIPSDRYLQKRVQVWNKDGVMFERVKGKPSNGIFKIKSQS